ncbi:related to SEY1-GTPase with a role in ER morphology [Ustilago bromivora]|uniref:Related to SEY1 - GTPase with a role in ER morphology n=1 Tax=Ustilago bromivora TaxID=307758 RepID=A0A1K0GLW7_9BASI|nr:related to SEY1-GTPase with a role in ER morphology [Ustilago bromivora]SYW84018.1 related to SEY1 - GTPase with a role in ER morphology [Ustilago bromivora]
MEINVDNAKQLLAQHEKELSAQSRTFEEEPITLTTSAANGATAAASPSAPSAASAPAHAASAPTGSSASKAADTGGRMQLIDQEQKFNSSQFAPSLQNWGLADAGFGYDLCAVLGSQSTGKSTLLNKLFGTNFDVMSQSARQQTTKGIWMCKARKINLLVMDVEGTDGRERGEDQDFERKSALFSMASAEVLIVNLWEHQVGLYQGANMALLKTVFEVNLALFQASKAKTPGAKDKTLLLFVIRDHIGVTPLQNLSATVMADLTKIWLSLSKPDGLGNSQISDFFDFMFTTLPHKILQPAEFDKAVDVLRNRFVDPNDPNFVFKTEYHKRIPADGLPHYLESIWEQVMTNKDLDLPTQQELLAQFRCDEIANAAFGIFAASIKHFRKHIERGSILETLGPDMALHRSTALREFDRDAGRYHQDVYKRKRLDLLDKLNSCLSPFFLGQLKNLHRHMLQSFKKNVLERMRNETDYDFGQVVSSEKSSALTQFSAAAQALLLADTDWTIDDELAQLDSEIQSISDTMRVEETKKMVAQIERTFKKNMAEPVQMALNKPEPDMWDRVLTAFRTTLEQAEATYLKKAKSFNCTEEENQHALVALRRKAWLSLKAKVDEETTDSVIAAKLRNNFEDRFRYDEAGVPRVWKPEDDIDSAFRKARDETLSLIPLYSKISPQDVSLSIDLTCTSDCHPASVSRGEEEDFDFPSTLTVLSEARKAEISTRFRKEADALYVEAKRSTVPSVAQIPVWMFGVMALLGWNEFMAVISSPVYFTFLLVLITGVYVVWKLNLGGPLASVAKAVGREVHRLAHDQLRTHFTQPIPQPALLSESRPQTNTEEIALQDKS